MGEHDLDDTHEAELDSSGVAGVELVGELRQTLERAGELLATLESRLRQVPPPATGRRAVELERRLEAAETDFRELAHRLVETEHQAGRLMNLYVATYQLHATMDPQEVQDTIAEIAVNLLGAERFVLLLRDGDGESCEVALARDLEESLYDEYAQGRYPGGDPAVDATLRDGVLRISPGNGSNALAVVPLRVEDSVVGALVLLKLFDHRPMLRSEDRDLLELISAHAASALFSARIFVTKDRRLRTLESLVELARGR